MERRDGGEGWRGEMEGRDVREGWMEGMGVRNNGGRGGMLRRFFGLQRGRGERMRMLEEWILGRSAAAENRKEFSKDER